MNGVSHRVSHLVWSVTLTALASGVPDAGNTICTSTARCTEHAESPVPTDMSFKLYLYPDENQLVIPEPMCGTRTYIVTTIRQSAQLTNTARAARERTNWAWVAPPRHRQARTHWNLKHLLDGPGAHRVHPSNGCLDCNVQVIWHIRTRLL